MIRLASIFTLVLGFTGSSFGAFGTPKWTTAPNAAAVWPAVDSNTTNLTLHLGNITALACLRDGVAERMYAGNAYITPSNMPTMDFTTSGNSLLMADNYLNVLSSMSSLMGSEHLFSSVYMPVIPEYDICNCPTPAASHGLSLPHQFCRCAANLNDSGLIWANSFDSAYTANFFTFLTNYFDFAGSWQNPWGATTWRTIANLHNAAADYYAFSDSKILAYQPVLNALATLPAFDRTLEWRDFNLSSEDKDDIFAQIVKYYEFQGTYYGGTFIHPGETCSIEITEFDEIICTNSVTTNFNVKPIVCSYSHDAGIGDGYLMAVLQYEVDYSKGSNYIEQVWEAQNPTVDDLRTSGDYEEVDELIDEFGVTYTRFIGSLTNPEDYQNNPGFVSLQIPWKHTSSSIRTFYPREYGIDDTDHLNPLNAGNGVDPEWQDYVDSSILYAHLRGISTQAVSGVSVSVASNLHATVSGSNFTNLYDTIISKVNSYNNTPECDSSTQQSIGVIVDASNISVPLHAPVYVCSSEMSGDTKVYPSGIYYRHENQLEYQIVDRTYDLLTFYPDVRTVSPGSTIGYNATINVIGIINQVDWNFKSITK